MERRKNKTWISKKEYFPLKIRKLALFQGPEHTNLKPEAHCPVGPECELGYAWPEE